MDIPKVTFEVIVLNWDNVIRTTESIDELHAAEALAEEFNKATNNSLVKTVECLKMIIWTKGIPVYKFIEVTAAEVIQYQADETDSLF